MANPTKLIVGGLLGASGIIGGGAYYLINQNKETNSTPSSENKLESKGTKKSISAWLDSDGKVLLEDGAGWVEKWENFKKAHPKGGKAPNKIWDFTNWDPDTLNENGSEFMKKCNNLSKSEIDSKISELYEEVKTYCTTDKVKRPG